MRKSCISVIILLILNSCSRTPKPDTSILESYRQYQIVSGIKIRLKKEKLSEVSRDTLISLAEQIAPKDAEIKLIKAANFQSKGKLSLAQNALEEAIKISPGYSPAFSSYGEFLIANGYQKLGRDYCRHAVALNPINIVARNCAQQ